MSALIVKTVLLLLALLSPALCAPIQRCLWNGSYYSIGESFNHTLHHLNETIVCEECICQEEGNFTCVNRPCPSVMCDPAVAAASNLEGCLPPAKGSCLATDDSGRVIPEGETYNPIIPGVGLIRCITCTCVAVAGRGYVSRCMKQPCPPPVPCGPNPPIENYVPCCPACVPVGLNSTPTPSSITLASCTPNPALTQNVYVNSTGNSVAIESTPTSSVSLYVWTPNQSYTATTMSTQQFYEASSAGLQLVGKSTSANAAQLNTSDGRAILSACTHNCAQTVVAMLQIVPTSELC
ncbi:hypothetical protein EMCRGX_G025950 [Ephydatia muelleri]